MHQRATEERRAERRKKVGQPMVSEGVLGLAEMEFSPQQPS